MTPAKLCRLLAAALCLLLSASPSSAALDPVVRDLGDTFVANLPSDWTQERGSWDFLDVADCYQHGTTCYGNNPSSPYGYPSFNGVPRFKLGASEAVVVFMRSPPRSRYFGFTQYLFERGRTPVEVLASLSDTLNLLAFKTLDSAQPGGDVFDRHAVLVWTGDLNTLARVKQQLALQGIPEDRVNFVPLPIALPLNMGYGNDADVFNFLLRVAMPTVQAEFDFYRTDKPFYVLKVGPQAPPPVLPAPTIGFRSEITGVSEVGPHGAALESLVRDIKLRYAQRYTLMPQSVSYATVDGFQCIAGDAKCTLDTHDCLYANDLTTLSVTLKNRRDIVIVAGVNHQRTGKALYMNHTVNDVAKQTGIVSLEDPQLTLASALYHAGVTRPSDPRVQLYDKLYAYAISYDCTGLSHCLQIPRPTAANPIGLRPGTPFGLYQRNYVDPASGVRASTEEVVPHQVFVGTRK